MPCGIVNCEAFNGSTSLQLSNGVLRLSIPYLNEAYRRDLRNCLEDDDDEDDSRDNENDGPKHDELRLM